MTKHGKSDYEMLVGGCLGFGNGGRTNLVIKYPDSGDVDDNTLGFGLDTQPPTSNKMPLTNNNNPIIEGKNWEK